MIDAYAFGRVTVNGVSYEADLIVFPDRVETGWWRRQGHRLAMEDLGTVLAYGPEVLVVGTGAYGAMEVPGAVVEVLQTGGIEVRSSRTGEACERFNALLAEGKRTVAALHLTC